MYKYYLLQCKVTLNDWYNEEEDPNCTPIQKTGPWVGELWGPTWVSTIINYDNDYPFGCLN